MEAGLITNLEQQIHFYLSYHQNKTNRVLHLISVPILYLSFLLFGVYYYVNIPFFFTCVYLLYVFYLDVIVGFAFLPFALLLYTIALGIYYNASSSASVLWVAIAMQVFAWALQLSGHSIYEGNKPAFLTSLVHAVLAAPIVIYLEALFSVGLLSTTQSSLEGARNLSLVASAQPSQDAASS